MAVVGLASGKWRATPVKPGATASDAVIVELNFSPVVQPPGNPSPGARYPIGTVTITTPWWSSQAQVYDIERTDGDEFFEPGYLVDATESNAVPLNLDEAPEWGFIVSDSNRLQAITKVPAGGSRKAAETQQPPKLDISWQCTRVDA